MTKKHGERAHSKFSASGAERWFNCPGSVELSEGMPDKSSPWAEEGTKAHEVLETIMRRLIQYPYSAIGSLFFKDKTVTKEMIRHGHDAARFIVGMHQKRPGSEITVEERVYLKFVHPEMFGTYDGAVVEHFGTLDGFDYKFGAGHAVSPRENLQMIFYGIGLAQKYNWNFKRVRLWIIQPRIRGYDGPIFWDIPIMELKAYVPKFIEAVKRVEENPDLFVEGSWCHWCKAEGKCPLKTQGRINKAIDIFSANPLPKEKDDGEKESEIKSEADWKKEARSKKGQRQNKGETKVQGRIKKEKQEGFFGSGWSEAEEGNFY